MPIFERQIGSKTLSMETGKLAQLAGGSVTVRYGDTVVLVTATMDSPRTGIDFFPLTIDIEERQYARGKIPGGFPRREGRPTEEATLTARLTDRPLRPLFPKGFENEVHVVTTTLSVDLENPYDIPSINGAAASLGISEIPFNGPCAATRVGHVDGEFVINPTYQQMDDGDLDIVVSGTRDGVSMLEAGAQQVSEDIVLEAIRLGQETNQALVSMMDEMAESEGKAKVEFKAGGISKELDDAMGSQLGDSLDQAMEESQGKADQRGRLNEIKAEVTEKLAETYDEDESSEAFEVHLDRAFRKRIIEKSARPDGRGLTEIRPLSAEAGVLPRTHGSSLFQRGETQVLGVVTLGPVSDAKRLDTLNPDDLKRFYLHYNFPPFSTGEAGRMTGPRRRDIGHGALAERALAAVMPSEDEFPYTVRLVGDVLSSNGSTSMGTVCACSMALMDAGIPTANPVAGISVGLITNDEGEFVTLTDIQGMEDHFGDMDFKVAGTSEGVTAIQLDIKVKNIGYEVIEQALSQAKEARQVILAKMAEAISEPREEMSPYAPRMTRIKVPVAKIGMVIGPGGKTIRGIVEETGATVDIEDDGTVTIGSSDADAANRAVEIIQNMTREVKVGEIFTGKVVRILNFGAFIEILPGTDGMVHISELADYRVPSVEDVLQMGEEVTVKVIDVDPQGKIALSRRALLEDSDGRDNEGQENDGGEGSESTGGDSQRRAPAGSGGRGGGWRDGGGRGGPRGGRPGGRGPRGGGGGGGPRGRR